MKEGEDGETMEVVGTTIEVITMAGTSSATVVAIGEDRQTAEAMVTKGQTVMVAA